MLNYLGSLFSSETTVASSVPSNAKPASSMKPKTKSHSPMPCPSALITSFGMRTGPLSIKPFTEAPSSICYYAKPIHRGATKTSFVHHSMGDLMGPVLYLGKGKPILVVGKDRFYFSPSKARPDVHILQKPIVLHQAATYLEVEWNDEEGFHEDERLMWVEFLLGREEREALVSVEGTPEINLNGLLFPPQTMESVAIERFGSCRPSLSHGLLALDFERDLTKETGGAFSTLAFRPSQAPFSFHINGILRFQVDSDVLEGIVSQGFAPWAYYDEVLDLCFVLLGPIHLGRYESIYFRKD